MSALFLSTVGRTGRKTRITFSANGLVTIESLGQERKRRVVHAPTQSKYQMKRRFLLNVIITQGAAIFQLFAGKNQTLLIRWDALLVLDFGLDVVNRIRWFHIKSDGLASQSLDKDLHFLYSLVVIIVVSRCLRSQHCGAIGCNNFDSVFFQVTPVKGKSTVSLRHLL
jgi:hypothetical protein